MIKITKVIARQLDFVSVRHKGKYLPVIVELCPHDILTFRAKGTRRRVEISLDYWMILADIMDTDRIFKQAKDDYKAGKRKRKPKKPYFPYSSIFYKALGR